MENETTNSPEYTVSELAFALKRTVEETYGRVRVRGELGRVTIAKSGHCYLDVKDDKAVINSIIWKGVMGRLPMVPEEGMEVICEGKLSTYPGRSNYQLIIDRMELAGEGALMALLERRKRGFAAEGLFDEERKKPLPFMPKTIGVVTSPTGAVIRDILHRIEDRYGVHVIVWPVVVQGKASANEVARAINGFNAMDNSGPVPRPDVLIIARGGGSIEDLWGFNEEIVVRAAAGSAIPLISAIGHETDWTLLDYIADYRAPTPTAAAEMAVPVRADLVTTNDDYGLRLRRALARTAEQARMGLNAARLPRPQTWLGPHQQRLDIAAAKLPSLLRLTDPAAQKLSALTARLMPALMNGQDKRESQLCNIASRLTPHLMAQRLTTLSAKVSSAGSLLSAYSYQGVLARGYALVTDTGGHVVRDGARLSAGDDVTLTFKDDVKRGAKITDGIPAAAPPVSAPPAAPKKRVKPKPKKTDHSQLGLF